MIFWSSEQLSGELLFSAYSVSSIPRVKKEKSDFVTPTDSLRLLRFNYSWVVPFYVYAAAAVSCLHEFPLICFNILQAFVCVFCVGAWVAFVFLIISH